MRRKQNLRLRESERRMTKQLILATVIVSLLGGTIVGQKKADRPPIPSTFRGIDATAPADKTSIGDLKWFEVFKDEEPQNLVRTRSEEHTSELQSLAYLVCRLLLEKKKKPAPVAFQRRRKA